MAEEAEETKPTREPPSQTRKAIWGVGLAVGIYMIARGLWGVFTGQ